MALTSSILLTGCKGMLAHALIRQLNSRSLPFTGIDADTCDLTKPEQVSALFAKLKPTLVLNCAAFTNVDKCEEVPALADAVNGHAVATLATLSREYHSKLVHISTDFVFDGTSRTPYKPTDTPNPLSAYGRSKLLGETLLQQVTPPGWLIARTAWLYGPNGNCFPQTILNRARTGAPLKVVDDQHGCPTFTYDLADAIFSLLDANSSGLFHLVNSGQTTWHGFTRAILDEFAVNTDLSGQSSADYKQLKPASAARPAYSVLDTSDYTRATARPLPAWRDALHRYHLALQ